MPGTWSINEVVNREVVPIDERILMSTLFAVPGLWLATEASATLATNLEWFVTQFCYEEKAAAAERGISVYEVCNEIVKHAAGRDRRDLPSFPVWLECAGQRTRRFLWVDPWAHESPCPARYCMKASCTATWTTSTG